MHKYAGPCPFNVRADQLGHSKGRPLQRRRLQPALVPIVDWRAAQAHYTPSARLSRATSRMLSESTLYSGQSKSIGEPDGRLIC